jgi:alpha-galactosidase
MVTQTEMEKVRQWIAANFEDQAALPFSFNYGGRSSRELLADWPITRTSRQFDAARVEHVISLTDPATKLEVRCVAIEYADFPTVEWTVYLKNNGNADTPLVSDLLGLDINLLKVETSKFLLHHHLGTRVRADDFAPFATDIAPNMSLRFAPQAGRALGGAFPYFNLEMDGQGLIVVVGWPGQWAATFNRNIVQDMHITARQEQTHFVLHAGEEVRTPLMVLQFYEGDSVRAQNIWRRWMLAHNLPKPHGKLPPVLMNACSSHQFNEMQNANTENQKLFVDRYLEEKLPLDYWWMDAGWYKCANPADGQLTWWVTGTWEVDEDRFPGGLKPISDHTHAKGVKTIVWFEPERVYKGTWLDSQTEWLLVWPGNTTGSKLLNLGNPEALQWLINHVDNIITSQGIDLYRQDYNIDPLAWWQANDTPDRQGMTEQKYVVGYLAYWDELLRRHPDMLIDTCASGGHRNDLETLRRSVPFLRSDYILEPIGQQNHTYGLSSWIPYHGTGDRAEDIYQLRSMMGSCFIACFDMRRADLNYDLVRKFVHEWKEIIAPNYYGDFYPLTPYNPNKNTWMALQFDQPEAGKGVIQAFRRDEAAEDSIVVKLCGLDPKATYRVTDIDTKKCEKLAGGDLLVSFKIEIKEKRGSAVLTYEKMK